MAHLSMSCSVTAMTTNRSHDSPLVLRPGIFFVASATLIYAISHWVRYELMLTTTSLPQPPAIRLIEWLPILVTQIFALAAIVNTPVLWMRASRRLYQKPSQCSQRSRLGRLIGSCSSGVVAISTYYLGIMATYELWNLSSWTYQLGILAGAQYPLFRLWQYSLRCRDWFDLRLPIPGHRLITLLAWSNICVDSLRRALRYLSGEGRDSGDESL